MTPFDDVKKGERYLGSYFVICVVLGCYVSTCIWTYFVFDFVFVDMWTCVMVLRLA